MFKAYPVIKNILALYPETRDSDEILYIRTCEVLASRLDLPYTLQNMTFIYFMRNRKRLGFPSIESVGRMRRKLQRIYPSLQANQQVQEWRSDLEQEYEEFAIH